MTHRRCAAPHTFPRAAAKMLAVQVRGLLALVAIMALQTAAAASGARPANPVLPSASEAPSAAISLAKPSTGKRADFGQQAVSGEVSGLASWIVDSADNQGMPFMVVDKVHAQVLVFDNDGRLKGAASALLGLTRGDDPAPGIGERKLSSIQPHERITQAGRFVASLDRNLHGAEILWIDYATALSLHRVVKGTPRERRAQRLASATPADNRVSFGCINVPVSFYDQVVSPAFTGTNGIVYILPETRTAQDVFGSYDVDHATRRPVAATPAAIPKVPLQVQQPVR